MTYAKKKNSGKTALVLAGGGLTGAVYEIGALRAIDDLLIDRTVNDFDIYVGTSAGALVASGLANGFSPEDLLKAIDGSHAQVSPIQPKHIFNLDTGNLLHFGSRLPRHLLSSWGRFFSRRNNMTLFDLLWSVTEALPAGIYDGMAMEAYLRELLSIPGASNDFEALERELYIIATDLDNGERAVFSAQENSQVPISLAVAASTALPIIYKPVRIGSREFVDGGLRGNASLDLAIENGATLIVCINPMVPFDNAYSSFLPPAEKDIVHLSEKGMQPVAAQVTRIITHSSLHYHIKQLRRAYPDVDILLVEPRPDDISMFFDNVMLYSARLSVARHGFESATMDLAEEYPYYKAVLSRHGIPITRRLVIGELAEIQQSGYDPQVIRRVLEARSSPCSRRRNSGPFCDLTRALADLELALESL